jgi:hypothetical protein
MWLRLVSRKQCIQSHRQAIEDDVNTRIMPNTSTSSLKTPDLSCDSFELAMITYGDIKNYCWLIEYINQVFTSTKLTGLHVSFRFVNTHIFLELVHLMPHLNSLRIIYDRNMNIDELTLRDKEMLTFITDGNRIRNLDIQHISNLKHIAFFLNLCKRMKSLRVIFSDRKDLDVFVESVLQHTFEFIIDPGNVWFGLDQIADNFQMKNLRIRIDKIRSYTNNTSFVREVHRIHIQFEHDRINENISPFTSCVDHICQ